MADGLLWVETKAAAGGLRRLKVAGPGADVFPGPGGGWLVRAAGDPVRFLRSDDGEAWAELAGDDRAAAERQWAEHGTLAGSARDRTGWRVGRGADGPPLRGLRRHGNGWADLDAAAGTVVKGLGGTLLDAGGWRWATGEAVRFTGAPLPAGGSLRGKYDVTARRFTFAAPRSVHVEAGTVWVATDAGVLTFRDRQPAGQDLADAPAPGPDGAAAFVRGADGAWFLKVAPKGGPAAVFAFADGWRAPADPARAEAAVKEAEGYLVRGKAWRASAAEANPGADAPRVFHRARAGGALVRVTVRPGAAPGWDFEDAAAVAGPAGSPVVGTAAALVRVKDAAAPGATSSPPPAA